MRCCDGTQVGALVFGYMIGELVRIIHNLGEHSAYKFRLMTRVRQVRALSPIPSLWLGTRWSSRRNSTRFG